jgi:hypothetical protein
MALTFVSGDPLLTRAHFLAFGHNARGRTETGSFDMALMQHYPAPFSTYQRRCRQDKHKAGTLWLWYESNPGLAFLTVRESSVGATRLRYVQAVLMNIARDYRLHGLQTLAIAPLGSAFERAEINLLCETWLTKIALPVVVYTDYLPGIQAEENFEGQGKG